MPQMQPKVFHRLSDEDAVDNADLVRQLEREIICLEGQLTRLKQINRGFNEKTLATYREMIVSRKAMLTELLY